MKLLSLPNTIRKPARLVALSKVLLLRDAESRYNLVLLTLIMGKLETHHALSFRSLQVPSRNSFFGDDGDFFSLPSLRMDFPKSIFDEMPSFEDMWSRMNNMMRSVVDQVENQDGNKTPTGQGRLYVIKSGPGYFEKKTYEFGPDGIKTITEGKPMQNDMSTKL